VAGYGALSLGGVGFRSGSTELIMPGSAPSPAPARAGRIASATLSAVQVFEDGGSGTIDNGPVRLATSHLVVTSPTHMSEFSFVRVK
jgi:hypothetical protein